MSEAILDRWKQRAAQAEANRDHFTFATQAFNELYAEGFERARITHAEQDGREYGKRSAPGVTPVVEDRTLKFFLYDKADLIARKKAGIR